MPGYFWVSLGGALALSLGSLLGKALMRYRICDAGLITWQQGLATAAVAGGLCVALRLPFPKAQWFPVVCLSCCVISSLTGHCVCRWNSSPAQSMPCASPARSCCPPQCSSP